MDASGRLDRLEKRIDELEQANQRLREEIASSSDIGRRRLLQAVGIAGVGALGVYAGSETAAAAPSWGSATGDVGSSSTPLANVYAATLHTQTLGTDVDANQKNITNVNSIASDSASINSNEVYIQGSAPSSPSTGDIWIDNDG